MASLLLGNSYINSIISSLFLIISRSLGTTNYTTDKCTIYRHLTYHGHLMSTQTNPTTYFHYHVLQPDHVYIYQKIVIQSLLSHSQVTPGKGAYAYQQFFRSCYGFYTIPSFSGWLRTSQILNN